MLNGQRKPGGTRRVKSSQRKRYGKSIANKAPAMFLAILEQKVIASGGSFQRIVTWKAKASQSAMKPESAIRRSFPRGGIILKMVRRYQRDLYSAFLIQHTNKNLESFNLRTCEKDSSYS